MPSKYAPVHKMNKYKLAKIFKICRQCRGTKSTDFINKYHKHRGLWSNKIAYLAGLVDGEGYLKVEKWGTIRLIIGMTDKKTINWIYENFGGNIAKQKRPNGKPFYVWRMNQGKDLFYLLLLLIPFLVTKKKKLVNAFKQLIRKFTRLEHTISSLKIRKG